MMVTLPWPGSELSGHAKGNWRTKARHFKAAKTVAHWTCLALPQRLPCWPMAALTFRFYPPATGGLPDAHNMSIRCKAYIDGIAAAMGCDDRKFRARFPDHLEARNGAGRVEVEIAQ